MIAFFCLCNLITAALIYRNIHKRNYGFAAFLFSTGVFTHFLIITTMLKIAFKL